MRYVYAIRNQYDRENIDLTNYSYEIKKIVSEILNINKNDIDVYESAFEFISSFSISKNKLRKMGRGLARLQISNSGFIRQKNNAYAFLTIDLFRDESEQVLVELVDCNSIERETYYRDDRQFPEWVSFYRKAEISAIRISLEQAGKIFGYENIESEQQRVHLVETSYRQFNYRGRYDFEEFSNYVFWRYHKRIFNVEHNYSMDENQWLEEQWDEYILNENPQNYEPWSEDYNLVLTDYVEIRHIDTLSIDESRRLQTRFEAEIQMLEEDEFMLKGNSSDSKYIFTVHNVGQGLATSLGEKNQKPFFYFDYGIGCGRNRKTGPWGIRLPIQEDATILLSHVDEDHWCGFRKNADALKCRWIIPQKPTKILLKLISTVLINGGEVKMYPANGLQVYNMPNVSHKIIAGNAGSTVKPMRSANTVHQNGNALYIFAERENEPYKILVSGDQDYDYQFDPYLQDVNLLVACHHGGEYSWSKKATLPSPAKDNNKIVYSYGKGNTYGHPSKVSEYSAAQWRDEHHTARDYAFEVEIEL